MPPEEPVPENVYTKHRQAIGRGSLGTSDNLFLFKKFIKVQIKIKIPFPTASTLSVEAQTPLRPFKKLNSLTQFLENDRKVLRFQGIWHDGLDKRRLSLLYYLSGKIP